MVHVNPPRPGRKGVVLLVVIAMLALFASLALSFVFYAEATAVATGYGVQAQTLGAAEVEPELALRYFLSQLIYDTDNEYSSMRGHSLGYGMYGYNPAGRNDQAYAGHGRLRYQLGLGGPDNHQAINYRYFDGDLFFRDPGYYGTRNVKTGPKPFPNPIAEGGVPWTYPDLDNVFLAAVNANGEVLLPSFTRPWTMNPSPTFDPSLPANRKWLKYLSMRPHVSHHPQFLTPDAESIPGIGLLDVKNLDWARGVPYIDPVTGLKKYSNNDSSWIDLGWPVMTAADGRKYKVLFAPLIMDLDNRVNLWIAGGYRGGAAVAGHQGWGRWEINPQHTLSNPAEFANLFMGFGGVPGRYGPNGLADGARPALMGAPAWYARFDFDGNGAGKLGLPTAGSLFGFPTYPAQWDSGNPTNELVSHPWNFRYFLPVVPDDVGRPPYSNIEAQLRLSGKGSSGFTSDLFKLLPGNFLPANPLSARTRGLNTFLSFDFNKPGLVPYYTHNPDDPTILGPYGYNAARGYPVTPPIAFPNPDVLVPPGPPALGSEFTTEWRSKLAILHRVNLNRTLREYPKKLYQDPGQPNNLALQRLLLIDPANAADAAYITQYNLALADRAEFAKDIYLMLLQVTGAQDPNTVVGIPKIDPRFQAARWLAQLAVNIVDYIDQDDYHTPFLWYRDPVNQADQTQWETVFGTELPKLAINEFYGQLDNNPADGTIDPNNLAGSTATTYRVNSWVELHDPFIDNTPSGNVQDYPLDRGEARLRVDDGGVVPKTSDVYRIVVSSPDPNLRNFDNLTGVPDPTKQIALMDQWAGNANQHKVLAGNGYYAVQDGSNRGFFIVGPDMTLFANAPWLARNPNLPVTYATPKMTGIIPANVAPPPELTVVLQRLACPYLPFDNNPASALYNPYITVDLMEGLTLNTKGYYDSRLLDAVGLLAVQPPLPNVWASWGRRQPYAGINAQGMLQNPIMQAGNNQPKHTFFWHNARENPTINPMFGYDNTTQPNPATPGQTITTPFNWLLHLDRQLNNPLELLHVSAFRNHELTYQFVNALGTPFQHYAPWLISDAILYRFLEMSYTPDLINGIAEKGRTPGKININTIWDLEVFRALCDANPTANNFTPADIDNLWANQLLPSRTPGKLFPPLDNTIQIGPNDRPFWPFSAGYTAPALGAQYPPPNGLSIQNTLLRDGSVPGAKLFFGAGAHPYQQYELLTKIYNNTTTRSNCFAVYLTVGFFEVLDEDKNGNGVLDPGEDTNGNGFLDRDLLGGELGRSEGRHIRHRMFALIDRTHMKARIMDPAAPSNEVVLDVATAVTVPPGQKNVTVTVTVPYLTYPTRNGRSWTIQPGTLLTYNPNMPNEETVVVQSTNAAPPSYVATFTKDHAVNEPIICRMNMGPWPLYNPKIDTRVVPYFGVID